jgi:phosphoribosylformylglycinamidine cyclo-ligase
VTGGGLAANLSRVLPPGCDALIDRGSWEVPPIFTEIAATGGVDDEEMARVFNLGIGMVLVVDATSVGTSRDALQRQGVASAEIGTVVSGSGSVLDR